MEPTIIEMAIGAFIFYFAVAQTSDLLHRIVKRIAGQTAARTAVAVLVLINAVGFYAAWAKISEAFVPVLIGEFIIAVIYTAATMGEWVKEAMAKVPVAACPDCSSAEASPIWSDPEKGLWRVVCSCGKRGPDGYGIEASIKAWNADQQK